MSRTTTTVLAATALLLLVGCGDDDASEPEGTASGDADLSIVAEDVDFGADAYEATAGTVEVEYVNEGMIEHSLVIEGVDDLRLLVESRGDIDRGSVDLEAGSYVVFCDIPGHRQSGMEAELEVS